jgi:hypothetical protein
MLVPGLSKQDVGAEIPMTQLSLKARASMKNASVKRGSVKVDPAAGDADAIRPDPDRMEKETTEKTKMM